MPSHYNTQRRNFSVINIDMFKDDVKQSMLNFLTKQIHSNECLNNTLININQTLQDKLDTHAPSVQTKIRITKHIVKNKEIQEAKGLKEKLRKGLKRVA